MANIKEDDQNICWEEKIIPKGTNKIDYQLRKKFIANFYAGWIAANTTKHIYNESLNSFIEVKYLSINETAGKAAYSSNRRLRLLF